MCKRVVIVGGGLIGIELVEMFFIWKILVIFFVWESSFWNGVFFKGESEMINRYIKSYYIDLWLFFNLKEIIFDENGKVKVVIIEEIGEEIFCDYVGLIVGVIFNIDFLKNSGIEFGKGVKVNCFFEINIEDIYIIGDCVE